MWKKETTVYRVVLRRGGTGAEYLVHADGEPEVTEDELIFKHQGNRIAVFNLDAVDGWMQTQHTELDQE